MKKTLLDLVPYPLLLKLYYSYYGRRLDRSMMEAAKILNLPTADVLRVAELKKSNTLFIMGSGASINMYTEEQWQIIKSNDSFGFNFSFLHPHVPNFYTIEAIAPYELDEKGISPVANVFISEFSKVRENYANTPIFLSDLGMDRVEHVHNYIDVFKNDHLYVLPTIRGIALNERDVLTNVELLDKWGYFDLTDGKIRKLFKYRATVSMLVSFGMALGYQNIVLCGIDLNSAAYFYEDDTTYPHLKGFRSSLGSSTVHRTLTKHGIMQPIDSVIYSLKALCERRNVGLYVARNSSALFPRIPVFPPFMQNS